MSSGALGFMVIAWGVIIGACIITLNSLVKHSKQ